MSSDWPWIRLGDHCLKIGSGATPKGGKDSYFEFGPYSLIRSQNVYNDGFVPSGLAFISEEQARKLDSVTIKAHDILLNITGDSVARVCIVPKKYLPARVNQHVAIIRPNPANFDSRFVRYFLTTPKQQNLMLGLSAVGATRNALTKGMIEDFKVPCPPLNVQCEIADILTTLDDRIALLRETNTTLEAIAQTLFKSWFVDFDPVHAKLQGREPQGMDAETAALFPDSFEESELGLVPRGWKISTLGNCSAYLNRGISPKYVENAGIIVINQKCIRGFSVDLSKARRHDSTQRKVDGRELFVGDVVVNSTGVGTLGRVAQILTLEEPMIVDSHVTVVRSNEELSWNYLGLVLMRKQPEIESFGEGSTGQTELNRGKLAGIKLVVPPKSIIDQFDEITIHLRNRFAKNLQQAQTLATLRDTLLPRLISGQLRLPDAEALIEETV